MMEPIALHDGRVMQVHGEEDCAGEHCCIHRPSDHPLNTAPLFWLQPLQSMYRVCPHEITHPDPDDLSVKPILFGLTEGPLLVEAITSSHMAYCDGCCHREQGEQA